MSDTNAIRQKLREQAYVHARDNLFSYVQLLFNEAQPSGSFLEARHTRVLAAALEKVVRGEIKRLLIAIPPRFGKSLLASVMLPTWMLGHDPAYKIICASYGEELARDFAAQSRNIMTSPLYRQLFPHTALAVAGTAMGRLETTAGGHRYTTSVGGALTGKGADLVIVDDPLKAADGISSQAARDTAFNWITGTVMSRFDRPADGQLIVLSQRLHMDDLIARLRDEGDWELLSIPAEALTPMALDIGETEPWRLAAGDLLFPERFGRAALDQLRRDLGEANYAAQILQDPVALGGTVFKVKDIVIQDYARFDPGKMEAVYQSWDTAVSEEETAAWSVCTTWGIEGKRFALIDVFRQRLGFPGLLKAAREQYARHKPRAVFIEHASSGIGLIQQLRMEGADWVVSVKPKISKMERAMFQAPKFEARRVWLPGKAPWANTYLNEIAAFPNGRSDQVDATTQFLWAFDNFQWHPLFRELRYWRRQHGE